MKTIFIAKPKDTIELDKIRHNTPIFAKKGDKLAGMVIQELEDNWILRIGGRDGCNGHYDTRKECMEAAMEYGYTFHVEE